MLTKEFFVQALDFILGPVHKTMLTALLAVVANIVINMLKKEGMMTSLKNGGEQLFAYTIFIVIANRLDDLVINNLFGWQGSTQLLVCLAIVAIEAKKILLWLETKYGIRIPILNDRLDQMEQGQISPTREWSGSSDALNQRIKTIKEELKTIEKQKDLNKLEQQKQQAMENIYSDQDPEEPIE